MPPEKNRIIPRQKDLLPISESFTADHKSRPRLILPIHPIQTQARTDRGDVLDKIVTFVSLLQGNSGIVNIEP